MSGPQKFRIGSVRNNYVYNKMSGDDDREVWKCARDNLYMCHNGREWISYQGEPNMTKDEFLRELAAMTVKPIYATRENCLVPGTHEWDYFEQTATGIWTWAGASMHFDTTVLVQ